MPTQQLTLSIHIINLISFEFLMFEITFETFIFNILADIFAI